MEKLDPIFITGEVKFMNVKTPVGFIKGRGFVPDAPDPQYGITLRLNDSEELARVQALMDGLQKEAVALLSPDLPKNVTLSAPSEKIQAEVNKAGELTGAKQVKFQAKSVFMKDGEETALRAPYLFGEDGKQMDADYVQQGSKVEVKVRPRFYKMPNTMRRGEFIIGVTYRLEAVRVLKTASRGDSAPKSASDFGFTGEFMEPTSTDATAESIF